MPDEAAIADPPEQDVPDQGNPTDAPASVQAQSTPKENEVVSRFKKVYPAYEKFSNEELTPRIAAAYPQFLKNKPFSADFERIKLGKLIEEHPPSLDPAQSTMQSREGGVTDFAKAASGRTLPQDVMLVPELSRAVPALAKGVADFLHAPFKLGQMATDAAINKLTGKDVHSDDPLTTAGKALNTASEVAGGAATDIAVDKLNPLTGDFSMENTKAAFRGEEQPDQSRLAPYQKIYKGGAEMVPLLSSAALLKGAGMSSSAAFGLPMYETTLQATGDPVSALTQGAVGALLGPVSEIGHVGGETLAARVAAALKLPENATVPVLQAGKVIGSQSLMNALMLASQSPELMQEMRDKPDAALSRIYHTVGMNLAFEAPHIPAQMREALAKDLVTEYFKGDEYKKGVDAIVRGGMRPEEFPTTFTVQTPESKRAVALAQDSFLPATAEALKGIGGDITNEEIQKQKEEVQLAPKESVGAKVDESNPAKTVAVPTEAPASNAAAEANVMPAEGTVAKPADAAAPISDFERYNQITVRSKELIRSGQHESPEYKALQVEREAIKNKNGGHNPLDPNAPDYAEQRKALDDKIAKQNVSTTQPATGALPGTDTQRAGVADISRQTTNKGATDETVKSTTEGNGPVQSDAKKANADAQARETGHADEQAQGSSSGDEGVTARVVSALESLKFDQSMGSTRTNLLKDIPVAIWNGAVDAAILAVKAGGGIAHAMTAAVRYIQENHKQEFDEAEVADRIREAFKAVPESTSTKNAITQSERAARGLPPVRNVDRSDPKAQAEQILKDDPTAGSKIVRDIIDTPNTPVNDVQQEVLLAHKSNLRANITAESDRMVDQKLTEQERETARKNLAELLDEHNRIDQATKNAGKTWSDTGRLRQQLIQEDFSFPTVVAKARFAKGADLTQEEINNLKKQSDAWEAKQAEIDKAQAEAAAKQREQHGEDAKTDAVTTVTGEKGKEPTSSFAPHIIAMAEKYYARRKVKGDAARAAIRKIMSQGRTNLPLLGIDPEMVPHLVDIGAEHIAKIGLDLAKFTDAMVADASAFGKEFGDKVRANIGPLFEASKKQDAEISKLELGGNAGKVKRVITKEKPEGSRDLNAEKTSIVEGLKDAVKDEADKPDIGRYARKVAENFIASEVEKGRNAADVKGEEIDSAVHDVLKDVVPDITPVESRDAWTQYGKYKPATTEPVRQRLIQASNEQRKVSTLERLQKGLQGLRSGQQRVPDTDYSRRLTKQINQLNKELGIVTKDPAAQLKSTLDAIKTRNNNRIADLRYENSTGKRIVKEKGVSPSDAETIAQRAEIEKLKAENDAIFGDKELTDEQRLERAIKASERAETEADSQLTRAEKGDFGKDASGKPLPASGKLDEIKARTAAMREQTKLLRDLDTNFQEQKRIKEQTAQLEEVDKRIEEVTRQINEGDVSSKTPADKPVIPELAQKRAELAELNKIKAKLQAAEKAKTPAEREAAKVTAVQERIDEVGRQINEGDIAARKRGVSTASPERFSLQEELKELNKIKAKLRAAEKAPTAEEREAKTNQVLQERIDEVARQINEGEIAPKPTTPKPVAASTAALRSELADLNKARQELRNAAKPKKTPEEIALQSAKTRISNSINEIKMRSYRLGLGDASATVPKPRRTVKADPALIRLQTQKAEIQRQFQKQLLEYKLKQRTPAQRAGDLLLRINREFAISGLSALFVKLPSYSAFRFAERPLHEVVALGLSKLPGIRDVAARAPSEVARVGIGEVKAMAKDYANAVVKGVRDAKDSWVDESELKKRYDPHIRPDEAEFRTFFGRLHQMEKSPLIRFTWERSFRRRLDFAAEHGEDITDPTVLQKHGELAYADALNEALVNRNALVGKVTRFVDSLAEKDKVTGRESGLGKAAKFAFQLENPVLHVPLNYVARTAEYVFGGVYGLGETAVALRRGIETLGPEEANQIMRHLTKGAIGNAAILTGFLLPQMFGGFWSPTRNKNQELKPGEFKTPVGTAPKSAGHNQLINAMQFGATMRQISESKLRKSDTETAGLSVGAQAAFWGLVDETPYAREMSDYVRVRDPRQSGKYWSEKAKNKLVPQAVQQAAEFFDKSNGEAIKRDPKGALQTIQSGIPYLRNQLPEKIEKARAR